jgi:molecular chaperone DnaJ
MQGQSKDIHAALDVTLDEALRGLSTNFEIQRLESCPDFQGAGVIDWDQSLGCQSCHGSGHVPQRRMVQIKVPAGIDNGSRIKISGKGHAGLRGGQSGHLYLIVSLQNHPLFLRKGVNLYCKAPVLARQSNRCVALIPTLEGDEEVMIPDDHLPGAIIRLRGRGMPKLWPGGERGDLFARVWVEPPATACEYPTSGRPH